eukprot:Phypoly_transcript_15465.p1 GENE.Phypoly_transcript_15465~~Phypoly_transcript_15465.p1  ORF type:complete len:248 (+),score=44.59 Phypoly_transcript_15465:87-830(+)
MRIAFCFFLSLLVLTASAFDAHNALDFAEGFAFGITDTITRNTTACVGDFFSLADYYNKGFEELEKGLNTKSSADLVRGITNLGHGIERTGNLLVDCGVISTALHVGEIGYKINQGQYISIVVTTVAAELLHKGHPITTNIKNTIDFWGKKEYYDSGKSLGKVIGLILAENDPATYVLYYRKGFEAVSEMFDLTTDAAGKVADGGKTAWDWAKDTANDVAEGAKDAAEKVADEAEDVAKKVGGWFHW